MLDSLILKQLFKLWHHQNILVNHHGSFASTRPFDLALQPMPNTVVQLAVNKTSYPNDKNIIPG